MAAATARIRIGSGGVMLPHYSPLKVAETFSMLSAIFPDRIDLGSAARGTDPLTVFALQRDRRQVQADDFPQQLAELLAYLDNTLPPRIGSPGSPPSLAAQPASRGCWSSPQSGIWAAQLGLPYAFADFINPTGGPIARRYRETFEPSSAHLAPRVIVATWALCAETDAEAQRLAASARMAFALFLQGQPGPIPPVDEAVSFLEHHADMAREFGRQRRWTVGAPETVREQLEAIADDYGADEIMVVTITTIMVHGAVRMSCWPRHSASPGRRSKGGPHRLGGEAFWVLGSRCSRSYVRRSTLGYPGQVSLVCGVFRSARPAVASADDRSCSGRSRAPKDSTVIARREAREIGRHDVVRGRPASRRLIGT